MDDVKDGWDDQRVAGCRGERRGGMVVVEPSCGVAAELWVEAHRGRGGGYATSVMTPRVGGMAGRRPDAVENAKATWSRWSRGAQSRRDHGGGRDVA